MRRIHSPNSERCWHRVVEIVYSLEGVVNSLFLVLALTPTFVLLWENHFTLLVWAQ